MSSPVRQASDTSDVAQPEAQPPRIGQRVTGRPGSARRWPGSPGPRSPSPRGCRRATAAVRRSARGSAGHRGRVDRDAAPAAPRPPPGWRARTLLPSTTTQTASSSDQVGRDSVWPSSGLRRPRRRRSPIHSDDAMSGRAGPQRHHRRDLLPAARQRGRRLVGRLRRTSRAPAARADRPATPAIRRPARAARPPAPSAAPGSVAATSEVFQPSANRSSSAAPSALITYGPVDVRPGQRPDDLCGKQLPAVRIGGRQVLQIDAGAAVAAADAGLAAVGAGHRSAQPQRRGRAGCARVLAISGRGPAISLVTSSVASWSGSDTAT